MKITKVEAIPLRLPEKEIERKATGTNEALVIKVHTDEGIIGIGESFTSATMGKAVIDAPYSFSVCSGLGRIIIGENPLDIGPLYEKMYNETFYVGRRGLVIQSMAGIDMALWDIAGKYYNAPIHKLMGGAFRKSIRCYASDLFGKDGEETYQKAKHWREQGFTAVKFGWSPLGQSEKLDIELVEGARRGMGDENDILIDAGCCYNSKTAIRRARQFEQFNPYWLEEPVDQDNIEGYQAVASNCSIPISGGEGCNGLWQFKSFIDNNNTNIIQIDLADNGFTVARKVAEYAEMKHKQVCNHFYSTPICLAASIQFVAAFKSAEIMEYCVEPGPIRHKLIKENLEPTNGYITVGDKPGLGITLDEDFIEEYRMK